MSIIGKQLFSSQSIALTCCALVAVIALANIIIAIAEQDGNLTIIYPAILMVGIVLSLFFKTMQTNIFYLIVMTCVSACLTIVNQEQLQGYA
ncbi:MAG: hypothetical protein J6T72_04280 [Alphaproteobacteria bacterium]|nr:hypothetical protein [Alphaproteobacteria bacterium]